MRVVMGQTLLVRRSLGGIDRFMLLLAVVGDRLLVLSGILVIWSPRMCTGMDRAGVEKLYLGMILVEGSVLIVG